MSWEISHTDEAWTNVERRLSLKKSLPLLRKALIDDDIEKWEEEDTPGDEREMDDVIRESKAKYRGLPQDVLVEEMMDRIREHRTCTNGGFEFYLDRQGYHTISVDDLTPAEERALSRL